MNFVAHVQIGRAKNEIEDVEIWLRADDVVAVLVELHIVAAYLRELQDNAAASENEVLLDGGLAIGREVLALDMVSGDRRVVADLLGEGPEILMDKFVGLPEDGIKRFLHPFRLLAESQTFENGRADQPFCGELFQLSVSVAFDVFRERVGGPLNQSIVLQLFYLLDGQ